MLKRIPPLASLLLSCSALAAAPTPTQPPDRCVLEAAQYHNVHPGVLRAVLMVESGLKEHAINRNQNGTHDVGIGQINSIHFAKLSTYGISPEHLLDACVGTYVAAWFLNRQIRTYGNTWQGIATYHSATPVHNQRYAQKLYQQMVRDGWVNGPVTTEQISHIRSTRTTTSQRTINQRTLKKRDQDKLRAPMMIEVVSYE